MKPPASRLYSFIMFLAFGLAGTLLVLALLTEFHEEITDLWLRGVDDAVANYLRLHSSPPVTRAMFALSLLGYWKVLAPVVGVGFVWLLLRGSRREALIFVATVGGGSLINVVLKLWFQRPRPSPIWALAQETSFSFPSGHSVAAFTFYGAIAWLAFRRVHNRAGRAAVVLIALILIVGIGASRVYLGVHYPSDVAAGYLLGFGWLATVVLASTKLPSSKEVASKKI